MNIMHSSRTDAWFTPLPVLDLVRKVLGTIDLDPASDAFGNSRVGAVRYYSLNGCSEDWEGTLYVNPPGGKVGNDSQCALFWKKLMWTRSLGKLTHAIFMCFSAEAASVTQGHGVSSIMKFPFCVPKSRLRFDDPYGNPGKAPSHSNIIVYVPGTVDFTERFVETFEGLGDCKR